LVAVSVCLCACGGTQLSSPITQVERAYQQAAEIVTEAVDRGVEADESQEVVIFPIRYNPVSACGCPDWEIVYRGRWIRVFVETSTEAELMLDQLTERAERDRDAEAFAVYRVAGHLDTDTTPDPDTGIEYRNFRLVRVENESDSPE